MWIANANNEWTIKVPEIKEELKLILSKKAEKQIKALCGKYEKLEWLAGLVGYDSIDHVLITELRLYEQKARGAFVELTNDGSEQMAKDKDIIGWIHSHNTMNVFFSGTDLRTSGYNKVSLVVNNKFEFAGKMKIDTVYGEIFVPLKVYIEKEDDDEIIKIAEELIKEDSTYVQSKVTEIIGESTMKYYDEEKPVCAFCERLIKKKNMVEYEGEAYHKKCLDKYQEVEDEDDDDIPENKSRDYWKEEYGYDRNGYYYGY